MLAELLKTVRRLVKVKTNAYTSLSLIYDEVMKEVNYKRWAEYILDIIEDHLAKKNANILELSAGNGMITKRVSKKFPNYISSDISLEMLRQGDRINVKKVCCDMVVLPFTTKFDVIFSTFDSVNYLLSKRRLLKFFKEIKKVLSENGIFTFDVSLEKNSREFKKMYVTNGSVNGYKYKRVSKYNPKSRIHKNIFEITDQFGIVTKEIHLQKIFNFDIYFDLFSKAGLVAVECLDAFTFNNGNQNSERIQFILKSIRN